MLSPPPSSEALRVYSALRPSTTIDAAITCAFGRHFIKSPLTLALLEVPRPVSLFNTFFEVKEKGRPNQADIARYADELNRVASYTLTTYTNISKDLPLGIPEPIRVSFAEFASAIYFLLPYDDDYQMLFTHFPYQSHLSALLKGFENAPNKLSDTAYSNKN